MSKFLRGPFETVAEVNDAIRTLREEGYQNSSITVVANREEDLRALEDTTSANIKQGDPENLVNDEERPFWQQINDSFTGYFFNQDYKDSHDHGNQGVGVGDDANQMLAGFRDELEDGKIILLVEDIIDRDAKLNLNAIDDINRRTDLNPDPDENEGRLQPNSSHIPSESLDTYGEQHAKKKYRAVPDETDVTPIFDDPTDAGPRDVPQPGDEDR